MKLRQHSVYMHNDILTLVGGLLLN